MLTSWRQWCRLCAKEHSAIDIFFKDENNCDIPEVMRRFFQLSINPLDEAPVTICTTCYQFLNAITRFADRVSKVDAMFSSIIFDEINSIDYASLKYQFGLAKEESPCLPCTKCDQATDTADLNIEFLTTEYYNDETKNLVPTLIDSIETEPVLQDEDDTKMDPLVNSIISMEQDELEDKTDKESLENLSIDFLEESRDDNDDDHDEEIESDTGDKDDEDYKVEKKARTATPKRKGRKRKEPPFICNKCDLSFLEKNALRYHKRTTHFTEKKEFQCQHCDKKFPTLRRVQQHEIVHLEPDQKPAFPCPHCDKRFTQTTNLHTHIRTIHVGERPFICEACGKSFATTSALKEHKYTHMEETPFQCSTCAKRFKTLARLKKHEDIHNGTMYVCPNCGLILNTKRTLQMHMVVHSDQKKHKCTICNSEFKRAKALKNHLILHSGLRPYTCPFCDKTFANGSNCRSHKKKAHPVELAAMEAAGEICRATNIPELEQLKAS